MPRISIVHTTAYSYRNPVGLTRHRMLIRPDDSHDLRLHRATLTIDPAPARILWKHDVFNNSICFLEWPETLRTQHLNIVSTLDLTHRPAGATLPACTLEPSAELFPFSYEEEDIPQLAGLLQRHSPDPDGMVDAWSRRFISNGEPTHTLKMLEAMTHAIKAEFRYGARHEEGTQTPVETLTLGSGTCRDFAVLMMEALRSLGLAARFVTGYLYDDTSWVTQGGGSTHAWCSVYLPGAGWTEYDPTNGLVAGANLIRVGVTPTAEQALPISGGFVGAPNDPIGLDVCVAVSAAPIMENASALAD